MSILEDIVSTSSEISPTRFDHVQPRGRLRSITTQRTKSKSRNLERVIDIHQSAHRSQDSNSARYEFRRRTGSPKKAKRTNRKRMRSDKDWDDLIESIPIPRHNRATRYALRCKDILQPGEDTSNVGDEKDLQLGLSEGEGSFTEREREDDVDAEVVRDRIRLSSENEDVAQASHSAKKVTKARRYQLRDRRKMLHAAAKNTGSSCLDATAQEAYSAYMKRQSKNSIAAIQKRQKDLLSHSVRSLRRQEKWNQAAKRVEGRRLETSSCSGLSEHECSPFSSLLSSSSGQSSSSGCEHDFRKKSRCKRKRTQRYKRSILHRDKSEDRLSIKPISVDPSITWENVGGLHSHIEALKEMVLLPLLYPEFYKKFGVNPPSGVLFHGPPGTGKTLLARALVNSFGGATQSAEKIAGTSNSSRRKNHITFYMRKGSECLSKWVGEAERHLRLLFEEAKRNEPSVIFFDELDGLAPIRNAKQDQTYTSIVSTLLALMDGLDSRGRVVVIGATNRLDAIDPALRRPGRFDRELAFHLPTEKAREQILHVNLQCWTPVVPKTLIQKLAKSTRGFCGADLKALCVESALCALGRTYPQVYESSEKLLMDVEQVHVVEEDFESAMMKLTSSHLRTCTSYAASLPSQVHHLLENALSLVLAEVNKEFPTVSSCNNAEESKRDNHCAMSPVSCGMFRLLISGSSRMAQRHVGNAVLHALEKFSHVSVDYASLVSDRDATTLEEALIRRIRRASSSAPCIIYLPDADRWWQQTPENMHLLLNSLLDELHLKPDLPFLFLATAPFFGKDKQPGDLDQLFITHPRASKVIELPNPCDAARRCHFHAIFKLFETPPKLQQRPSISTAKLLPAPALRSATPSPPANKALRERDLHILRELRIFLCQVLDYCFSEKQYHHFYSPVDISLVPVYPAIISQPMNLTRIQEKLHDGDYKTFEAFMSDIDLIVKNAHLLNPKQSKTRFIAHTSGIMKDNILSFAHRFRKEQGFDLFAKCRAIEKKYAKLDPDNAIEPKKAALAKNTQCQWFPNIDKDILEQDDSDLRDERLTIHEDDGLEIDYVDASEAFISRGKGSRRGSDRPKRNGLTNIRSKSGESRKSARNQNSMISQINIEHGSFKGGKNKESMCPNFEALREEYFDTYLLPILRHHRWSRDTVSAKEITGEFIPVYAISSDGSVRDRDVTILLHGATEAIDYVKRDRALTQICFGSRFLDAEDEQERRSAESKCLITKSESPAYDGATIEPPGSSTHSFPIKAPDPIQPPDFIYDHARMECAVSLLMEKSSLWPVEDLEDAYASLKKLADAFRNEYDRRPLMLAIEEFVENA